MTVGSKVAIDSQCLSFLIDALKNFHEPTDSLAEEKKALFRAYLYSDWTYSVTPTVESECRKISIDERRELHAHFVSILFLNYSDPCDEIRRKIDSRVEQLVLFHPRKADCTVVAECEYLGQDTLLTYDFDLVKRLSSRTSICLRKPSEFWKDLAISRGSTPIKAPNESNPLNHESWWIW